MTSQFQQQAEQFSGQFSQQFSQQPRRNAGLFLWIASVRRGESESPARECGAEQSAHQLAQLRKVVAQGRRAMSMQQPSAWFASFHYKFAVISTRTRSHPWDLNPRPALYESAALPLS